MNGGKAASGGYTIVETLIFLAVTGALFLVASVFIGNKQASTEFTQATRDFQSQLEDYINDINDGFYPSTSGFNCTADFTNGPQYGPGGTAQGSNTECIFAGKVLQFNTGASTFNIYTLAGNKQTGTPPVDAQQIEDAKPTAVINAAVPVDLTQSSNLQYGLQVTKMYYETTPGFPNPIGAVGFISGFGDYSVAGDPLSGTNNVMVLPIRNSTLDPSTYPLDNHSHFADDFINPDPSSHISRLNHNDGNPLDVVICTAGGNGVPAAFIIGSDGRQATVEMHIGSYGSC